MLKWGENIEEAERSNLEIHDDGCPLKLGTEALKHCGQSPRWLNTLFFLSFLSLSHSQSHFLTHTDNQTQVSSFTNQILYALVHSEETMPGKNCTTSVFSVLKLNLILLLHCDRVIPHRPAATQMRHTLVGHFLYPSSELQKVDVNCYFVFLHIVPTLVSISGKSRQLYQEAEWRHWQIFTSSPTSMETIINHQFAVFWQKQTGRHTNTLRHIWAHWRRHCLSHMCHVFWLQLILEKIIFLIRMIDLFFLGCCLRYIS